MLCPSWSDFCRSAFIMIHRLCSASPDCTWRLRGRNPRYQNPSLPWRLLHPFGTRFQQLSLAPSTVWDTVRRTDEPDELEAFIIDRRTTRTAVSHDQVLCPGWIISEDHGIMAKCSTIGTTDSLSRTWIVTNTLIWDASSRHSTASHRTLQKGNMEGRQSSSVSQKGGYDVTKDKDNRAEILVHFNSRIKWMI